MYHATKHQPVPKKRCVRRQLIHCENHISVQHGTRLVGQNRPVNQRPNVQFGAMTLQRVGTNARSRPLTVSTSPNTSSNGSGNAATGGFGWWFILFCLV